MKKLTSLLFSVLVATGVSVSSSYASEDSVYEFSWLDKDKEIYVLQNRKFKKDKTFYIGGTLGRSLSGAFIDRLSGSLFGGFFFTENLGIEVSFTKGSNSTNATHDAVKEASTVAFYRQIESDITAHIVWSPFYSKINTFNKIVYYDWLFGAGLSQISTKDNRNEFDTGSPNASTLTDESGIAFSWFTGFRFFLTDSWSTRLDFRGTHSNADRAVNDTSTASGFSTKKSWFHYYDIKLGLNYTF